MQCLTVANCWTICSGIALAVAGLDAGRVVTFKTASLCQLDASCAENLTVASFQFV